MKGGFRGPNQTKAKCSIPRRIASRSNLPRVTQTQKQAQRLLSWAGADADSLVRDVDLHR